MTNSKDPSVKDRINRDVAKFLEAYARNLADRVRPLVQAFADLTRQLAPVLAALGEAVREAERTAREQALQKSAGRLPQELTIKLLRESQVPPEQRAAMLRNLPEREARRWR